MISDLKVFVVYSKGLEIWGRTELFLYCITLRGFHFYFNEEKEKWYSSYINMYVSINNKPCIYCLYFCYPIVYTLLELDFLFY